jgi:hypothetical protein
MMRASSATLISHKSTVTPRESRNAIFPLERAVAWLTVLLVAGSITFTVAPPSPLGSGNAPHFNPVICTLDPLLPVVGLCQRPSADHWMRYGKERV